LKNQNLEAELLQEFGTATFSVRTPLWKSLGWESGPVDRRDHLMGRYLDSATVTRTGGLQHWHNPIQLDQGREGACVGFGTCGVINAAPEVHSYLNEYAHSLYKHAQQLDPWPGEAYEGTSVRAGADAARVRGHFTNYAMTYSVNEAALWLLNRGPITIGVDWYTGMDRVDEYGYIHPTGSYRGGHCVVVDGVVYNKRGEEDRFRIRNSWGPDYGLNGRCRISAEDLQNLLDDGGVACLPVEASEAGVA
jgi:hypothetical protein